MTHSLQPTDNSTAEDLLKSQTVGLVHLSDFRKRRAEAQELKDRESQSNATSGLVTPVLESRGTTPDDRDGIIQPPKKKKKRAVAKGKLSFGLQDDEVSELHSSRQSEPAPESTKQPSASLPSTLNEDKQPGSQPRLGPHTSIINAPKAMTKLALSREAQTRDRLRKEFLEMQEAVKAADISLPFVFFDGSNTPGGICQMKKGDHVWLFLDKARKVGAELGVGGADKSRREWARVGVDDLMLVRGEVIVPHHYDFYYFIINAVQGLNGPLFDFASQPMVDGILPEGDDHDPTLTKVVDRRWYERNKHIYPASIWLEYDPAKVVDYSKGIRKDVQGNAFFY